MKNHNYKNSIKLLLSLRDYIDKFFDHCLVMTDDTKRRDNRLTLLSKIKHLFDSFADFSMIVIQGEEGKRQ